MAMASTRRIGAEDSETRAALLGAAEQLMLEEGYAAVSSRRIAQKAGLKPQLVHYYFRTMDDLFLAAFRRRAEQGLERQAQAIGSAQPLRALWELSDDSTGTALMMEFAALANHRKSIRSEIARYGELFRARQAEVVAQVMEENGIDTQLFSPLMVMVMVTGISQLLVMEEALGMTTGHAEMRAVVEQYLEQMEGSAATPGRRRKRS
jgi:AcrR family transcriptional regulator